MAPAMASNDGSKNGTGTGTGTGDAASLFSSSNAPSNLPDVTAFSILAKRSLTDALDKIAGAKTLVLDAALAGPLGLVAEMSLLRDHGVDKLFWLERGALSQAQKNIVYVCRPEISLMRIIADQIKSAPASQNHSYTLLLAPRVTSVCASVLEDLGVFGSVEMHELPMSLIPLERDVLSLELGARSYRDIYLDSDYESIYEMGRALVALQRAFGNIPRILGKGDASRRLTDIMARLRKESPAPPAGSSSTLSPSYGQIDSLILLDRQVDMVTPLCTQLTYEGLIDEIIGIKHSFVEVDANLTAPPVPPTPSSSTATHFGAQGGPPRRKKHLLSALPSATSSSTSSSAAAGGSAAGAGAGVGPPDPLFAELRDKNFTVVGGTLNRVAKRINENYEQRHAAQTVGQMREFVGKLSALQAEHQALRLHTGLTEQIMGTTSTDEFNRALEIQQNLVAGIDVAYQEANIRELINQEASVFTVLRLLCLYSLMNNGLKPKVLEEIKREVLQTYGYEYLPLLVSLADLNLLVRTPTSSSSSSSASGKSAFVQCRRLLKLIVDDVDEDESAPEDVAYVYSGYAPVSVRLVQHALGLGQTSGGLVGGLGSAVGAAAAAAGAASLRGAGGNEREKTGANVVGWRGLEDVMRTLPGAVFDEVQKPVGEAVKTKPSFTPDHPAVTVVCFVGGCTYTEIAALRFTSQRMSGRKIIVLTTGMLNGNSIMDSLGPPAKGR